MATMLRARAALNVRRRNTVSVTGRANAMCVGIGTHPALFVSPSLSLSALQAQILVVGDAEVLAATRARGAAAARNVQRNILLGMMEVGLTYVQGIADTSASVDQAVATIQAAGLTVAPVVQYTKPILALQQRVEGGPVVLVANASALTGRSRAKTLFNWGYTADGGQTFVSLPPTPKSKTSVVGLTPLTRYGFRVSVTGPDGTVGAWSQIVVFLVR
jgi:hypothetical protein